VGRGLLDGRNRNEGITNGQALGCDEEGGMTDEIEKDVPGCLKTQNRVVAWIQVGRGSCRTCVRSWLAWAVTERFPRAWSSP
jgi:hypothetical protein